MKRFALLVGLSTVTACFTKLPTLNTNSATLCNDINVSARQIAHHQQIAGWSLAFMGAASTVTGTTILPLAADGDGADGGLSTSEKVMSASLTAAGVLMVAGARAFLLRSEASSRLASEGAFAMAEHIDDATGALVKSTPSRAAARCMRAFGTWEASRSDPDKFATALLEQEKKETVKSEADAERQKVEKSELAAEFARKLSMVQQCTDEDCKTRLLDSLKSSATSNLKEPQVDPAPAPVKPPPKAPGT